MVLLLLILYALSYLAWHFAIMGEQGALEWGDLSPRLQDTRGVGAGSGGSAVDAAALPSAGGAPATGGERGYEPASVPR